MYQDAQPTKYDPVKAHQYYEAHKQLKGRTTTSTKSASGPHKAPAVTKSNQKVPANADKIRATQARVHRLRSAVQKLRSALSEAEAALSAKRQTARKTKKANSDGKTTVKEKQSAKKYRDTHKAQIQAKQKSSPSKSSSTSVSSMSVQELTSRIIKIRGALNEAQKQLANANHELGQLAHSAITSDPNLDKHFAQFAISRKDSV